MEFKVSVIIPVYKAEKYIEKAVISAIEQPETGEIILIEDNSPDNSLAICEKLEKQFNSVRLIPNKSKKNNGAGASRNIGIKAAIFPFLAFLDADDYYLPGRFSHAKQLLIENENIDGVYEAIGTTAYDDFAAKLHLRRMQETKMDIPVDLTTFSEAVPPDKFFEVLLFGKKGWFHFNGLTLKKSVFNKVEMLDEKLIHCEDTEFFYRLAMNSSLMAGRLDVPVAMRGIYNGNNTLSIYTSEERYKDNVFYTSLMWEKLFIEMINKNFNKKINQFILFRHLDYYSTEFALSKVTFYRKLVKAINLLRVLMNYPQIIQKIL
ncbi:MAG: glycosyltransferase family 2 protein [Bacteroidota bacterium]|nr:glycosyltransferase family 2 protein [Bacteroidota bacterium]